MVLPVSLVETGSGVAYHTFPGPVTGEPVLITMTAGKAHGVFKAVTRTTAGTTIVAEPSAKDGIYLTDIIITTDKTQGSDVTVRFTDGTNTINIIVADSANNTVNLAISFEGRFAGWAGARIEVVTVNSVKATVTLGYFFTPDADDFATWDALR